MKITIFGAAGEVGSRIVAEALSRDHDVTAVVRNPAQFQQLPQGVTPCVGDAEIIDDVVRLTTGQDVAISAVRPPTGNEAILVSMTQSILKGVAQSDVRVLIVGGAASLTLPNQGDTTVLTAPNFLPDDVINIARACFAQHEICNAEQDARWVYISPPAMLTPGIRSGKYRLGRNELLCDHDGHSQISMEDFAVVLLDEAEHPTHHQTRFTAAY